MAAHKKPKHLHKTKMIKIMLTVDDFEKFQKAKLRLLEYSPPLRTYDILKKCVDHVDDIAFIEFLKLPHDHPIRIKLRSDYLFSQFGIN